MIWYFVIIAVIAVICLCIDQKNGKHRKRSRTQYGRPPSSGRYY